MITMEHYKHYNVSKKRKDKFKNLAMSLKSGLLIIVLSILMTRIKVTSGKQYDWNYISKYNSMYTAQPRHSSHYVFKKYKDHHKAPFFDKSNSYYKKPSRFPNLDKISNRLEVRLEHLEPPSTTSATINPFDDWGFITPNSTDLHEKYSYKLYNEPVTVKNGEKLRHSKRIDEWKEFEDPFVELGSDSKGSLHFTTSRPWEHEQRDVAFHGLGASKNNMNNLPQFSSVKAQAYVAAQEEPKKTHQTHSRHIKPTKEEIEERIRKSQAKVLNRNRPKADSEKSRAKAESDALTAEADRNAERIKREWKCKLPKAKVIRVHDFYPHPSKWYSPSCAIVHQCSDDTGCCNDLTKVCKPKNKTEIELSFFMFDHAKSSMKIPTKLSFVNHTECECQDREEKQAGISPVQNDSGKIIEPITFSQKIIESSMTPSDNNFSCICPSQYSVRYLSNGTCSCDCFDKQEECLSLKKGKKQFSHEDQLCIRRSICLPPACEYGKYITIYNRCPKKRERHFDRLFNRNIT